MTKDGRKIAYNKNFRALPACMDWIVFKRRKKKSDTKIESFDNATCVHSPSVKSNKL